MTNVDSSIERVTVFQTGAQVLRVAEIAPSDSNLPTQVKIPGLPLCLDDSTLTVHIPATGAGSSEPCVTDVRVGLEIPEAAEQDDSEDGALRQLRREEHQLKAQEATLDEDISRITALQLPTRPTPEQGKPPPPLSPESRLALTDFRHAQLEQLHQLRRDCTAELREASRKRKVAEKEQRKRAPEKRDDSDFRKFALIQLKPGPDPVASPVRLEIRYRVPGARWAPAYAVRVNREYTKAELIVRAVVRQNTGENWTGIGLTLSTASPEAWNELPKPKSLRIGRAQPVDSLIGWRPPPTGTDALFSDFDRAFDLTPPPAPKQKTAAKRAPVPAAVALGQVEELCLEDSGAVGEIVSEMTNFRPAPGAGAGDTVRMSERAGRAPAASMKLSCFSPTTESRKRGLARSFKRKSVDSFLEDVSEEGLEEWEAGEPLPVPPAIRPSDDLTDYGRLRMPPPESPGRRGSLTVLTQTELYSELVVRQRVRVTERVTVAVNAATRQALDAATGKLPKGYVYADTVGGFDYCFDAEGRVDIPADGDLHSVVLGTGDGDMKLLYVAVPRESQDVYRIAEFDNPLSAPLLEGPMDIYAGGDFLATSVLRVTPANGKVHLGMGVEQGIKISRNTTFREGKSGLTGQGLEHEIVIDIKNNLPQDAELEVRERIPVTNDEEKKISVVIVEVTPDWEAYEQDEPAEGTYRWRATAPAGGDLSLKAVYTIELSGKHELIGGNRRER